MESRSHDADRRRAAELRARTPVHPRRRPLRVARPRLAAAPRGALRREGERRRRGGLATARPARGAVRHGPHRVADGGVAAGVAADVAGDRRPPPARPLRRASHAGHGDLGGRRRRAHRRRRVRKRLLHADPLRGGGDRRTRCLRALPRLRVARRVRGLRPGGDRRRVRRAAVERAATPLARARPPAAQLPPGAHARRGRSARLHGANPSPAGPPTGRRCARPARSGPGGPARALVGRAAARRLPPRPLQHLRLPHGRQRAPRHRGRLLLPGHRGGEHAQRAVHARAPVGALAHRDDPSARSRGRLPRGV